VPNTSTPVPNTSTPVPKTSTPFATRDPTRALTPTGDYTPSGTSAPITPEPTESVVVEVLTCESTGGQLPSEYGCLMDSSWVATSSERDLWQALLDFLGLDFGRGVVIQVSGQ